LAQILDRDGPQDGAPRPLPRGAEPDRAREGSAPTVRPLGLLLIAVSLGSEASALDLKEVQERGTLRVLAVLDTDGGSITAKRGEAPGFDYELLEAFSRMSHVRLELVGVPTWEGLVPALRDGRGDVIAGSFTVTEARQQLIDFSSEVMPTRSVVVTRRPHRVVGSIEDLRGERITLFKGTSMADLLLGLGVPAAGLDYSVPTEGLSAGLRSGRITCVVHDVQTAILDQRADPELQLGTFIGPPGSYALGVRKGDTRLLAAVNDFIQNFRLSGAWNRLTVKYFGEMALEVLRKARAPQRSALGAPGPARAEGRR
jgi:ABC-type amino acid transport substrate-binding protein